jgi:hypothetical protein
MSSSHGAGSIDVTAVPIPDDFSEVAVKRRHFCMVPEKISDEPDHCEINSEEWNHRCRVAFKHQHNAKE